jgi:predicted metal-binding membrane protein
MRSKLAISAVVAASLFGATAIASAQTQTQPMSPGASGEGNAGTSSTTAPGKMKSNNMKQGTTTGAATQGMKPGSADESKPGGRSTARNPSD